MTGWLQQELSIFGFRTCTTVLWLIEQSSILCARFECPVALQTFLLELFATAHDCDTGLLCLH